MSITAKPPYKYFTDTTGKELESGKIYVGVAGLDAEANPITAYWDSALTVAALQPIRTIGGAPDNAGTPSDFFTAGDYSITVRDKNDVLVYSKLQLDANDPAFLSLLGVYKVYDTVALLLASTEASRGTGVIWEAGGFRYIEVASGGDVTNSAGTPVELDVLRGAYGTSVVAFGGVMDTDTVAVRASNKTALQAAITATGSVFIPKGTLWIDPGINLSGAIFGEDSLFNFSYIKGDGDLFTLSGQSKVKNLRVLNDVTRGKLFSKIGGGAFGRCEFSHCRFEKANYHTYSTASSAVDWRFTDCFFEDADLDSRYFLGCHAYTEIGCYTYNGTGADSRGWVAENSIVAAVAFYGSVFEDLTGSAIVYDNTTNINGGLKSILVSGCYFESNGTAVAGSADIELNVAVAARLRGLTVLNCEFELPGAAQTKRINITVSGGGSSQKHTVIGGHAQGSIQFSNDANSLTVLNMDIATGISLDDSVLVPLVVPNGSANAPYQEGTWTPILSDASTAGNVATTASRAGWYTKIGNLVTIGFYAVDINTSGMTAGNSFYIQDLPFTNTSVTNHGISVGSCRTDSVTYTGAMIVAEVASGGNDFMWLKNNISAAVDTPVLVSQLASGTADLFFTLTYKTDE